MDNPLEEIDILLDEIPRATSAPPHFKSASANVETSSVSCLPDSLFDRKLSATLPDCHIMSFSENPNPNENPIASRIASAGSSPIISSGIPSMSPKQQRFSVLREVHHLMDDNTIVGNALAGLSLEGKGPDPLPVVLENRNKLYNTNSLYDFSTLNLPSLASHVNPSPRASSMNAPSMLSKSLTNIPSSLQSGQLPIPGMSSVDRTHFQVPRMNQEGLAALNSCRDSNIFRAPSSFSENELGQSVRAKNLLVHQHQTSELVARQQGYDYKLPLEKGSYGCSIVESVCRSVHDLDLYGNNFVTGSSELTPDGHILTLLHEHNLRLARQSTQEKLHMQQLYTCQDAGLLDQTGYVKTFGNYPICVTDLKNLQCTSGSTTGFEIPYVSSDTKCRFYAQGHCIRGNSCPFLHPHTHGDTASYLHAKKESFKGVGLYEKLGTFTPGQDFLQQLSQSNGNYDELAGLGVPSRMRKEKAGCLLNNSESLLSLDENMAEKTFLDGTSESYQHFLKYADLEDLRGNIYTLAKHQHGCRVLQKKLDEAKFEDIEKIFEEIKDHVVQLMTDPFGNYLVQKLFDACNESHRTAILDAVTRNNDLINISLNITRAVQKLIETMQTRDQTSMLISCLKCGVVTLIKDLNGNHVVQRCLQCLQIDDNQFIFDAAASHCVEIATHKHGCCVMQRCLDYASDGQKSQLVMEIATNALVLSQDQFGNYVVQYILTLGLPWVAAEVVTRLQGNFTDLAMQKFSSNVVEKCLKVASEENKTSIIKELGLSSSFGQLLLDRFGNYVIQSALKFTKGHLHSSLHDAIKPHVPILRTTTIGKRILSRMQSKK
ncbi:hypothetical protein KP509_19G074400 [Ceratopteris richardii]|uniref:Uncharacterized protein n=1 Tax=Ceratopteris richardii TaxID=49495 RepID=A0A8T2SLQ4_CERRI|nr:hypothetical protein KP509_19G074400 [Ceratopteris richardii]